jgi:hypothetical protein
LHPDGRWEVGVAGDTPEARYENLKTMAKRAGVPIDDVAALEAIYHHDETTERGDE